MTTNAKDTSKKGSRKVSFDKKRAARFEARGVRVDNIVPDKVAVGLDGHSEEGENCSLCDHDIQWLFVLHLVLTDGKQVTFSPVGSSCIQTWADSLPISAAQAAIVAALKLANEKVEAIKASIRAFNAIQARGGITESDRDALVSFLSSPSRVRDNEFLLDVARKVERFGSWASDRQRTAWLQSFARERVRSGLPGSKLSAEHARIIERAKAVAASPEACARLNAADLDALKDIAAKVERIGSFASDRQANFLVVLVKRGEGLAKGSTPPTGTPRPAPQVEAQGNFFAGAQGASKASEDAIIERGEERPQAQYDGDDLPF